MFEFPASFIVDTGMGGALEQKRTSWGMHKRGIEIYEPDSGNNDFG